MLALCVVAVASLEQRYASGHAVTLPKALKGLLIKVGALTALQKLGKVHRKNNGYWVWEKPESLVHGEQKTNYLDNTIVLLP